jgi:hypothetical protein
MQQNAKSGEFPRLFARPAEIRRGSGTTNFKIFFDVAMFAKHGVEDSRRGPVSSHSKNSCRIGRANEITSLVVQGYYPTNHCG